MDGATLVENVGTDPYTGWAVFRVIPPVGLESDTDLNARVVTLVNVYKNARSVLEGVFYPLIYDGTYRYDGTRSYIGIP